MGKLPDSAHVDQIAVFLFGKFSVQLSGQPYKDLESCKAQELFGYLLLHRDQPQSRESVASLLWGDTSTAQSKSYLRKALWRLQSALDPPLKAGILRVEAEWIELNLAAPLWLDVAIFEHAFGQCQGLDGRTLDAQAVQSLQCAVDLYRGDLLEGWFQEWCLYERQRFQHMYLVMLDKLIAWCEAQANYELGILYGTRILRYDPARERTHRQLMRLYNLAGDRTGALRQYERCAALLHSELDVAPARQTVALYQQIRADCLPTLTLASVPLPGKRLDIENTPIATYTELLVRFRQTETTLDEMQQALRRNIEQLEILLDNRR
ncbi:MAG: hypothetical protein M3Q45_00085 [Chloroflexota bacterium]|nr:hypothetical protein [Chloroflexota bacterium]